eukprot:879377-Amphidinium_carterae.1
MCIRDSLGKQNVEVARTHKSGCTARPNSHIDGSGHHTVRTTKTITKGTLGLAIALQWVEQQPALALDELSHKHKK